MHYIGHTDYRHGTKAKIGILITNLGTPDEPTPKALRRYLKEFLSDPRVVEVNPVIWWLVLNGIILNTRPRRSAHAYQQIWDKEGPGAPLLNISKRQVSAIADQVRHTLGDDFEIALGMRYGNPSIHSAIVELQQKGVDRLLVLPLYPQYSASTSASTFDAVAESLKQLRWVPDLRFISHYHRNPAYIQALANSVREQWAKTGQPDHLLMSFHGVPQRYLENGDPYHCECLVTGRLLAQALDLPTDRYTVSFQSRFGREEWIKPYTDALIKSLPSKGVRHLDVICPGFSADCLETIEEIDGENRHYFMEAGGEQFNYIPALNDRADHVQALAQLVLDNLGNWSEEKLAQTELAAQALMAREMGAKT